MNGRVEIGKPNRSWYGIKAFVFLLLFAVPFFILLSYAIMGIVAGVGAALQVHPEPTTEGDGLGLAILIALPSIGSLIFWLGATAFFRNIHALRMRPSFAVSADGIQVKTFAPPNWIKPWHCMREHVIRWNDFLGCIVETENTFGIKISTLTLKTTDGNIIIDTGIFRPDISVLQQRLLDYLQKMKADDNAIVFTERVSLLEKRFSTPVRLPPTPGIAWKVLVWSTIGIIVLVCLALYWGVGELSMTRILAAAAYGAFMFFIVTGYVLVRYWTHLRERFVEMRSTGLAIGAAQEKCTVYSWSEIEFARIHSMTRTTITNFLPATTSKAVKLEVRLRSGKSVWLRAHPENELRVLAEVINNPTDCFGGSGKPT